jgi:hypothetical protein
VCTPTCGTVRACGRAGPGQATTRRAICAPAAAATPLLCRQHTRAGGTGHKRGHISRRKQAAGRRAGGPGGAHRGQRARRPEQLEGQLQRALRAHLQEGRGEWSGAWRLHQAAHVRQAGGSGGCPAWLQQLRQLQQPLRAGGPPAEAAAWRLVAAGQKGRGAAHQLEHHVGAAALGGGLHSLRGQGAAEERVQRLGLGWGWLQRPGGPWMAGPAGPGAPAAAGCRC